VTNALAYYFGSVFTTLHFLCNIYQECYILLGLLGTNTLAYWAHKLQRKLSVVNMTPTVFITAIKSFTVQAGKPY